MLLRELTKGIKVKGLLSDQIVTIQDVQHYGESAAAITFVDENGNPYHQLVYPDQALQMSIVNQEKDWNFNADGERFRLVSEAYRIQMAHLFDPMLAIHSSLIDPLPHQIQAVYEKMLPKQPLRFLLADDPGSGKTIMAGLLLDNCWY